MAKSSTPQQKRKTVKKGSQPIKQPASKPSGMSDSTKKEVKCITLVFVCIMLALSYYTRFIDPVGKIVRGFGLMLLGNTAYVLPLFALAIGIHIILKGHLSPHASRYIAAALICLCVSGLLAVQMYNQNPTIFGSGYSEAELARALERDPGLRKYEYTSIWNMLSNIIGNPSRGGGVLGSLVAAALIRLISPVGTTLLFWALILACAVIVTGTTPFIKLAELAERKLEEWKEAADKEDDDELVSYEASEPEMPPHINEKNVESQPERETKKTSKAEEKSGVIDRAKKKLSAMTKKSRNKKTGAKSVAKKNAKKPHGEKASQPSKPKTKKVKPQVITPSAGAFDENVKIRQFDVQPEDIPEDIAEMAKAESGAVEPEKATPKPKAEPAIPVSDDEISSDYIPYKFPPASLLAKDKPSKDTSSEDNIRATGQKLIDALRSFGVEAKITSIIKGPAITRFELFPATGVKVNKIVNLSNDIALNLAAESVRVIAPIPGKAAVGIEIPNENVATVRMRDVIESNEFKNFKSKTAFGLGKDVSGKVRVADVSKMPHLLIAGATGSGKSVCINTLITSIIYKADPNEVKMIMIDPKMVELGIYNGIPHLLIPVVTDPRRAAGALNWAVQEMIKRYKLFAENNVRNITGYNELAQVNGERKLDQIIIIVDELADLMMVSAKEVEDSICRLAQMARAAGMYLVIATQRPSVDVVTGLIKANIPSRIALKTSNQFDSRTILDVGGAEKLLGRGDMLFLPMGASSPVRIQGAYVSDEEAEAIAEYIKQDFTAKYDEDVMEHIERGAEDGKGGSRDEEDNEADDMLPAAIQAVVEAGQASASLLQRRLKVGYARAGRLIDQLEERGIIGPHEGSKPRAVLMTRSEYLEMQAMGNE